LVQVEDEKEALKLRALHIKLRRYFRTREGIKTLVSAIIQLEVQRNRLLSAFSQFSRLNP
ncbi:MAG TPA: hypothetical protein VLH15_07785, partial [Dehalococcoidales bacterium]|nr:hypothetical protein [Dehalococcoidales bacterium]